MRGPGTAGISRALAERAAPQLLGPGQAACADRLDQETGNLRVARAWCGEDTARAGTGLRLAAGLWEYWHIRGHLAEGTAWLEEALAAGGVPEGAVAAALNGLGVLVSLQGDPAWGAELFAESIDTFRRPVTGRGEARAWIRPGQRPCAGRRTGRRDRGVRPRAWRCPATWAMPGWRRSPCFCPAGRPPCPATWPGARSRVTMGARLFEEAGDHRAAGYAALALADCLVREGKPDRALAGA